MSATTVSATTAVAVSVLSLCSRVSSERVSERKPYGE